MGPSVFLADVHGFSEHSNTARLIRVLIFYFLFYKIAFLSIGVLRFPSLVQERIFAKYRVALANLPEKTMDMNIAHYMSFLPLLNLIIL